MKRFIFFLHALVGWLLCCATMGTLMATASIEVALILHAIAAPVLFGILAYFYYSRFGDVPPLPAAAFFTGFVAIMDALVVGLAIQGSLEMFESLLGTWIPFASIFATVWLVGTLRRREVLAQPSA